MAKIFRWLLRAFTALVILILVVGFLVYWLASRSLPDYSADHQVAGITAPVEIVRDNADVPHIFGATDEDVFFGLGFAHAQDRLWQMVMLRRTAQGRLSEIFGERTLPVDEVLRRLDLAAQVEPLRRCLECNGLIEPVDRATVWSSLEPKTRRYYDEFYRCPDCGKIYWEGSHVAHMNGAIRRLVER